MIVQVSPIRMGVAKELDARAAPAGHCGDEVCSADLLPPGAAASLGS